MSLKENLTHFSLDLSQNYLKEMTGLHACHRSADLKIKARVCVVSVGVRVRVCVSVCVNYKVLSTKVSRQEEEDYLSLLFSVK